MTAPSDSSRSSDVLLPLAADASSDVNAQSSLPPAPDRLTYSDAVKLVTKTLADSERRKRNVIVSGLSETANSKSDVTVFTELCRSALQMDVCNNIVSAKRLGPADRSKKRRLLIVFNSSSVAADVFSRARQLRQSNDKYTAANVFNNQDISREESRLAYLNRVKRRESHRPPSTVLANSGSFIPGASVHPRPGVAGSVSIEGRPAKE